MTDVLIVCTHFSKHEAAYRRLSYFEKFLRERGLDVRVVSFIKVTRNGIYSPSEEGYRTPLVIGSANLAINLINFFITFTVAIYILLLKPKIVVLSIPDHYPIIWISMFSKVVGAKLIIDVRDPQEEILISNSRGIERSLAKILAKICYSLYRRADAVLAVTDSLKDMLEGKAKLEAVVVPNGVDLEIFIPIDKNRARGTLKIEDSQFVIAYTGSIGGYYDIARISKTIAGIRRKLNVDLKLFLAGPLVDKKIISIISSPSIRDAVTYLGVLNIRDYITFLSAADVGIIPRVDDPIYDYAVPVKFYEYIAVGLPVIAICRPESLLAKIIRNNELGIVCAPGYESCIENAVKIMMNKEAYSKFKSNVQKFRWKVDRRIGATILYKVLRYYLGKEK